MNDINLYSNPKKALINAKKYLGEDTELYISNRKNMKYMILDDNNKFVHFGRIGYEDYTKHKDEKRRINYLKRATNIKGNWKNNKYSPNNLSQKILWT